MSWIVCAYYTKNTGYENHARNLIRSLRKFNLPYEITPIENLGNWFKNTQFKPTFLRKMMSKYRSSSIVYVDVDAIICRYPSLFDELDKDPRITIAAHVLDHTKFRRKKCAPELLSGTLFLKNCGKTRAILNEWIILCSGSDPEIWDQRALASVLEKLNIDFYQLPAEYVTIFDYMSSVKNPVIKHFQASRRERKNTNRKARQKKEIRSQPRRVVKGNILRIQRKNI